MVSDFSRKTKEMVVFSSHVVLPNQLLAMTTDSNTLGKKAFR
jgi:hypothetical protein